MFHETIPGCENIGAILFQPDIPIANSFKNLFCSNLDIAYQKENASKQNIFLLLLPIESFQEYNNTFFR